MEIRITQTKKKRNRQMLISLLNKKRKKLKNVQRHTIGIKQKIQNLLVEFKKSLLQLERETTEKTIQDVKNAGIL